MDMGSIRELCKKARSASRELALIDSRVRADAVASMGRAIKDSARSILGANKRDLASARKRRLSAALMDRLVLTEGRIASMADSLKGISRHPDPVGRIIEKTKRPNGLVINKVTVPIGVILIIYEARPDVTSDCAGLCLKSANAIILRGGSEAIHSNIAIFEAMRGAARRAGLPEGAISMIRDTDHAVVDGLLRQEGLIDLVIPRGGESLIREVAKKSRIPVIKHYKGVCHTYVDAGADLAMAEKICYNAKVQRPGVCNAMETLLVNARVSKYFLPMMARCYRVAGVEMRGCPVTRRLIPDARPATEADWYAEYLDLILAIRVVKDVDEAIAHIAKYGSGHSDAIITRTKKNAEKFLNEVDSAAVYLNASTRFTDGGEFGKGAEMGISTDKIHARGPMGLAELMSYKYVVLGNGQVRK